MLKRNTNYLAKDNFWTKDFFTTASSNFLNSFELHDEATVIKLLKKKGFFCLGKADLDEFACGGSGLLSKNGILINPHNEKHIVGGSSSGSSVAVAKGLVDFALGSDTGGSVRCPAAYCGVVGFKPSYGLISRYGLIPLSSSLDTVGILAKNVSITKEIFSTINKKDPRDLLTIAGKKIKAEKENAKSTKIAVIDELENHLESNLKKLYNEKLEFLKKEGYSIEKVKLPKEIRNNLQITYLIISCSELLSHLNSLQGIAYGSKKNKSSIKENRTNYLGKEIKKRLLMGAYFLENPYCLEMARKVCSLTNNWVKKIFAKHQFLLFPSMNGPAPKIEQVSSSFAGSEIVHWSDNLLLLANFSGIPSLSLPIGFVKNLPVSININSSYKNDEKVLELADKLEKFTNTKIKI
ncbi:MAG: Glutamyl-tRNA(Gln) amidotransferase subunit A [Mycoplasmataceae bacterium]|nr:MAG: Glutamyl-tRNA(Gln) amidotransferase subunit A [Mycoplasmataceae bacterium]